MGWAPAQWGVVVGASLAGAVLDLTTRKLPNLLTLPLFAAGLVAAGWWAGAYGVLDAGVAAVVLAAPYIWLFLKAGGGAGDAKLMAGLGAWLGLYQGLAVLFAVSLAGIALAVAHAWARRSLRSTGRNMLHIVMGWLFRIPTTDIVAENASVEMRNRRAMPYGLAIFLGVVAAGVGVYVWRH
jgi:prepilin peptidase CpaA